MAWRVASQMQRAGKFSAGPWKSYGNSVVARFAGHRQTRMRSNWEASGLHSVRATVETDWQGCVSFPTVASSNGHVRSHAEHLRFLEGKLSLYARGWFAGFSDAARDSRVPWKRRTAICIRRVFVCRSACVLSHPSRNHFARQGRREESRRPTFIESNRVPSRDILRDEILRHAGGRGGGGVYTSANKFYSDRVVANVSSFAGFRRHDTRTEYFKAIPGDGSRSIQVPVHPDNRRRTSFFSRNYARRIYRVSSIRQTDYWLP